MENCASSNSADKRISSVRITVISMVLDLLDMSPAPLSKITQAIVQSGNSTRTMVIHEYRRGFRRKRPRGFWWKRHPENRAAEKQKH